MSNYPLVFQQESINDSVKSKLIEIDPEISKDFEDLLNNSKKSNLSFKGEPSEEVVLCSADKTYLIKQAPTSDSLLITEIKNKDYNVSKILNNTHIMELIPGRLLKAYQLIERSSYNGVHNEHRIDPLKLLSLEQIKYSVQASDKEIEEYLKELNTIDLDGKIRLVNSDYLYDLLDMLLSYISSLGLNNSQFEEQMILDFIDNQDIDPVVFRHCFYCFTLVNSDGKYSLNKVKIARFVGLLIMNEKRIRSTGPISIYDFLQTWNEKLSEFELKMDLLNGLYYKDSKFDEYIHPINPLLLPYDIKERFQAIYSIKNPWQEEELKEIMEPLLVNYDIREKGLIYLKYCKFIIQEGKTLLYKKMK